MSSTVDIIIPAHNPTVHLRTAIESCFKQTYKNFRVIVIDDNSDTDVSAWLTGYDVTLLKTPRNLGPGGARNFGISHSTGDYICFLDADDQMHPNKLKHSVSHLDSNPNTGMTCGNYRIIVSARPGSPFRLLGSFYRSRVNINTQLLLKNNYVASGSVVMRRSIIEQLDGFNEKYWIAEDYDLWLRCSLISTVHYIHEVMYFYRIQKGGTSLTQREDIQKSHIANITEIKRNALRILENEHTD